MFHLNDRGAVGLPIGAGEVGGPPDDDDDPGFTAIAAAVWAMRVTVQRDRRGAVFDHAFQGWLSLS